MSVWYLFFVAVAYKPVIYMHGIDGTYHDGDDIQTWLNPGQAYLAIDLFNGIPASWINLPRQVEVIANYIREHTENNSTFDDGYHLVCHSQGATICRCLTEYMDDHKIDTLVSMAGPQLGVYGEGWFEFLRIKALEGLTADLAWRVLYTKVGQDELSVAQLWHDPLHQEAYLEYNTLLPDFNGELKPIPQYKENFLSLNKAVFVTGDLGDVTWDGGIDPVFTGAWAFWDRTKKRRISMKNQFVYTNDTFGLKTMDERGDLVVTEVPNAVHSDWIHNESVFKTFVLPHLT